MANLYMTHANMRNHIQKLKKINPVAKIMGLDIGRKYIGVAVSDKQITEAVPLDTFIIEPQFFQEYQFQKNNTFYNKLKMIVRSKHIKGIMVGYPLTNKNEHTLHCQFVERFIEHMWTQGKIKIPITLVNEYNTSMEAKAKIGQLVQNSAFKSKYLSQIYSQDLGKGVQVYSEQSQEKFEPEVMLRKGIYDKVAAQIILQRFIDFYNEEDNNKLKNEDNILDELKSQQIKDIK